MTRINANDRAWEQAFSSLELMPAIRRQGWVDVTAEELRQFREPRLMAKIDYSSNRPEIFRAEDVNILALSSSHYRIGKFMVYKELPHGPLAEPPVERVELPQGIESLSFRGITSESSVVSSALASGILSRFCGEGLILTNFGRMRTPEFDFSISGSDGRSFQLKVNSATIEIDASFENKRALHILEVKNHRPSDFNVRQLYYPYRTWNSRIKKPVETVFMTLSNDIYDLYRISFPDLRDFSSGVIDKHKRFTVAEGTIRLQDLEEIAYRATQENNWNVAFREKIPFPQADSFSRVVDLVSVLIDQPRSVSELAEHYGFDSRQSDYYYNAARYLGLATSSRNKAAGVELREATSEAHRIFSLPYREKYLALSQLILSIEPMNKTFSLSSATQGKLDDLSVQELFGRSREAKELGYSASTVERRARTIVSWVNWLNSISET